MSFDGLAPADYPFGGSNKGHHDIKFVADDKVHILKPAHVLQ
jgi:hypothetical protein